jgi:Ca-activated chloride channel family protein
VLAVEAPGADGFKVFEAKKNLQGERKQVTYAYGETMQTTLVAGDYVLVTDFTTDKADSETPFTIKAGERTELKVP